ncbi:bacterio-opsin activator domain-containing protein [Halococcus sediminicola]|uniref:bacterio-opsin activator domain-containing protein n=1 Tax=Halococcus sediminicola TaxID=1264579 RepID=UPI000679BFB8|nr:bacterio-opsin activator domain-containing protein [Halococcus sediminicola]
METVVTARVPATEFALSTTFEMLPDMEAAVDPIIESGDETATPVVRVRGGDRDALDDAFAADPSVECASPLSSQGAEDACSYRVDWSDDVYRVLNTLTAANGRILNIRGQQARWRFQLLYPRRENLLEAHEHWTEQGVTVDIERIHEADGRPSTDAGFTGT